MLIPISIYSKLLVGLLFASSATIYRANLRKYARQSSLLQALHPQDGMSIPSPPDGSVPIGGHSSHQQHILRIVYTTNESGDNFDTNQLIKSAETSMKSIRQHSSGPVRFHFLGRVPAEVQSTIIPYDMRILDASASSFDTENNKGSDNDTIAALSLIDDIRSFLTTAADKTFSEEDDLDHIVVLLRPNTEFYCDIYSFVGETIRVASDNRTLFSIAGVPSFDIDKRTGHVIPGLSSTVIEKLSPKQQEMTFRDGIIIVNTTEWSNQRISHQVREIRRSDNFYTDDGTGSNDPLSISPLSGETALRLIIRDHFRALPPSWNVPSGKLKGKKMTENVQSQICILQKTSNRNDAVSETQLNPARKSKTKTQKSHLFICKHFPSICNPDDPRLRKSVKAGAIMYEHIWGIGGFYTSMLVFLFLLLGVALNWLDQGVIRYPYEYRRIGYIISEEAVVAKSQRAAKSKRAWESLCKYWTKSDLEPFTEPLLTFKSFIAALLFLELNVFMAPEQSMLTTAEIVAIHKGNYPFLKKHVYSWAKLMMPGLRRKNLTEYVEFLQLIRTILLGSWLLFLITPRRWNRIFGAAAYSVGAIAYVYLGCIGLQYNLAHSTQGGMLFILSAIPAVPFLETSRRCNHWLRKFLYVGVLGPIYLFSGVCKIRYKGIRANFTGKWMRGLFENASDTNRVHLKALQSFIGRHSTIPAFLMSWGNIVTELVLPVSIMRWTSRRNLQLLFHAAEILFHLSIFLLIGPNFVRYCLLHMLALNPLGYMSKFQDGWKAKQALYYCYCNLSKTEKRSDRYSLGTPSKTEKRSGQYSHGTPSKTKKKSDRYSLGDYIRIVWALIVLIGWWQVQFKSDFLHLFGVVPLKERINPYWPWPELSMFAKPKDANIYAGLLLTTLTAFIQLYSMVGCQTIRSSPI